jgi:uncharacterized protein involved in tolerance to divalent cations
MKLTDKEKTALVIREVLKNYSDDDRKEIMYMVYENYCQACFRHLEETETCYCWNDE